MGIDNQIYDRQGKGFIKGDVNGNMFEVLGLDPVGNPEHMDQVRTLLQAWYGVKLGSEVLGSILPWAKWLKGLK